MRETLLMVVVLSVVALTVLLVLRERYHRRRLFGLLERLAQLEEI